MQGFWGLLISAAALPVLSLVKASDGLPLDSLPAALSEMAGSWQLLLSTAVSVISIGFFNSFGVRRALQSPEASAL